ncbi:MAG: alpha/beta hydrolase, partial [Oscillochloris sp.]|nr:alpha/beta hydrolase [Oscillochloris sp.]
MRHLYPFHTARLAVLGGTLSYVDEGSGPPVVMVHGNPTWSFYYRHLIAALRDTHRVIVPDHIGCG